MASDVEIIIPALKDMHVHLREGDQLQCMTHWSWQWCDTVLAMPNLEDPLTNPTKIAKYREQITQYAPEVPRDLIIPLYLTPETTPQDIYRAHGEFGVTCAKAYPKGRTTHSQRGISDFTALEPTYRALAECGMRLLIHPEHPAYDSWVAERKFFQHIWPFFCNLVLDLGLKISLEHLSTSEGVWAVMKTRSQFDGNYVVGTITPHHMLAYIGNLVDGLDSAYYCKPVLKQREDQQALREAATSGLELFLLGSDSAPWKESDKLKWSPCAGCWTSPWLPQLLATVFQAESALGKLQTFTHDNAVKWWGLKPSERKIKITSQETEVPRLYRDPYTEANIYWPFYGGRVLNWGAEIEKI